MSSFYTFDASGNTCQSLTSTGTPNYTHLVSAFGFSRSSGQDLYDGMGAQFGYRDENSGFIYLLGHRHYDAQFGQFMTRDPIGYDGGINLYAYTGNDPVNRIDPDGTFAPNPLPVLAPIIEGGTGIAIGGTLILGGAIVVGIGVLLFGGGPAGPASEYPPSHYLRCMAKGGKQSGKGDDPRYFMSCDDLRDMYETARKSGNHDKAAEIYSIMKFMKCKGSGGHKGQGGGGGRKR